jgi:hypothetical protein
LPHGPVSGGKIAMNQLAYSILEACEAIRSGELRAVKHGKRTLILADDLRRFLESLPPVTPKNKGV